MNINMLNFLPIKAGTYLNTRTFKNFGHKRQPVSNFTTLWHGFLTITFIGMGIEWKRIKRYFTGDSEENMSSPLD